MAARSGLFKDCPILPPTAIFHLTHRFKLDKHPKKLNLGVGAYRCALWVAAALFLAVLMRDAINRLLSASSYVGGPRRDEALKPVVFSAVRKAEAAIVAQNNDKEYLPVTGLPAFTVS